MKNVFTRDTSSCIRITLPRNQPRGYATFRKWKDLIWHVQLDRDRLPSSCNRWLQIIGQSGSNMPFRFFQTVCCATLCNFPATATVRYPSREEDTLCIVSWKLIEMPPFRFLPRETIVSRNELLLPANFHRLDSLHLRAIFQSTNFHPLPV